MPPRKKNCNSVAAIKKKKIIDNRLLEISILVEDYIYENKPIRRHEAEMYAKEVASYVDKCLGDERSLQVIEKLRRHMRSIIAEQGEPVDEDVFAQPLPGTTPVYLVVDDNMTPSGQDKEVEDLTQQFNSPNRVEEPVEKCRKKRKAIVKRNIRDDTGQDDDLTQCTQDIEIKDPTQQFNSPDCIEKTVEKERKKRKVIVKRIIKDNSGLDDDLTQCTQDAEIDIDIKEINGLNSVEKPNTRARNKRNVIAKRDIRKTKFESNVSEKYNSDSNVTDLCDDDDKVTKRNNYINVEERPQDSISSLNILNNEVPAVLSVCSPSILTSFDAVPGIITKSNVSKKPNSGGNMKMNDTEVKNVDKFTKTLINVNFQLKTTEKTNNINKQIYTQANNINKQVNPIEISKNKVDGALNAYSKENKLKKASIYSDKVINDLSWIENIRYVREIAKEEYEHVSFPDIFWDNYMLPEKWNDDDFSYT